MLQNSVLNNTDGNKEENYPLVQRQAPHYQRVGALLYSLIGSMPTEVQKELLNVKEIVENGEYEHR